MATNKKAAATPRKKEESAFKRVDVPKDAVLFALKPETLSEAIPELDKFLNEHGYKINLWEPAQAVQPTPEIALERIYTLLTDYSPDMQNKMLQNLLTLVKEDRRQSVEESEVNMKMARENVERNYSTSETFSAMITGGVMNSSNAASNSMIKKH